MVQKKIPLRMTELEERLAASGAKELHAQLMAQLTDLEGRARAGMRTLVSKADYELLAAAAQAATAAKETLAAWPADEPPGSKDAPAGAAGQRHLLSIHTS